MTWTQSLVKLSSYEVETLQKRLAEIAERRMAAEMRRAVLQAEGEVEVERARDDPASGWHLNSFMDGLRIRKAEADAEIDLLAEEEMGARDALLGAFEEQKKYEHVADLAKLMQRREVAKRETAVLDELGLRQAAGGR